VPVKVAVEKLLNAWEGRSRC